MCVHTHTLSEAEREQEGASKGTGQEQCKDHSQNSLKQFYRNKDTPTETLQHPLAKAKQPADQPTSDTTNITPINT